MLFRYNELRALMGAPAADGRGLVAAARAA